MSGINIWLDSKLSKYDDFTNREYIQDIFSIFYTWLLKNKDRLYIHFQKTEILNYFYIFIFNKYLFERESSEIIDMTFTSDIIDLYFKIEDTFGTHLLKKQNIKADDILIFINHITSFYEEEIYEEEDLLPQEEIIM